MSEEKNGIPRMAGEEKRRRPGTADREKTQGCGPGAAGGKETQGCRLGAADEDFCRRYCLAGIGRPCKWLALRRGGVDEAQSRGRPPEGSVGGARGRGSGSGGAEEEIGGRIGKSRRDYRRLLRRYAHPEERPQIDSETFDYVYYTFGMETYGDLPLIEPAETKEGSVLDELVIAIDTSGSCSLEAVRRFLEETCAILSRTGSFFGITKLYLLQCDMEVEDAALIRSEEEFRAYCRGLKIRGRAGTDFRPVFRYTDQLIASGELQNLRALIYFTDGNGIYPGRAPAYETTFVYLNREEHSAPVPAWAGRIDL